MLHTKMGMQYFRLNFYWMSQGKIKSIIDSVYSLEDAAQAHTKMLKGKGLFGKILMKPTL